MKNFFYKLFKKDDRLTRVETRLAELTEELRKQGIETEPFLRPYSFLGGSQSVNLKELEEKFDALLKFLQLALKYIYEPKSKWRVEKVGRADKPFGKKKLKARRR